MFAGKLCFIFKQACSMEGIAALWLGLGIGYCVHG